ncbi:MAG: hypothetical protein A2Z24_00145 [Candidatus Woykebacteria bacterium RBG_16_44_10]|uniref:Peptidase M10 metallopeptidase domain-containing protein n=1 Tax=Candidatus Woykebacteria bacterium RBG_16_44_10 TaxID=1802597 RepID=A0A1G1WFS6_9BACT|nr:MAG: hypothetical protein A2Z24_00145 [Candidatus Woykebacteria bacterium RBG_16_44_10]
MTHVLKFRYLIAVLIALILFFLSTSSLAEGSITLRVFNQEIRPMENHPARLQALVCNVSDKPSDVSVATNWKLSGTTNYRVNTFSAPRPIRNSLGTIVGNSFSTWSPLTKRVSFNRGADTPTTRARHDGQNIIAWNSLSRSVLGVTYIWYNTDTNYVVEVDTLLNSRQPWSWTDPTIASVDQQCSTTNAYDAQNILTHELGHWVGLDDLYTANEEDLTMYGYGAKQELKKDTLESGDALGVGTIYP